MEDTRLSTGRHLQPVHGDGTGGPLHLDPLPGQLVEAPAPHLDRGHHGRDLLDVTDEARLMIEVAYGQMTSEEAAEQLAAQQTGVVEST